MQFTEKFHTLGRIFRSRNIRQIGLSLRALADYAKEPLDVRGLPLFLQIEPTIYCNLECTFCINPFLRRPRVSLSLDQFRRIIDQVPTVTKISLVGIGESFMNKDLWKIIREAKERGITIGTTSNGTVLTETLLREIAGSGLDWLNFSLDGATKETYERMRPGAVFERVLSNVRRIAATVADRPRPVLSAWFLASRENIHELPLMVPLVKKLGISRLNAQGVHYWGHPDWHSRAKKANAITDLYPLFQKVRALAQSAQVTFRWVNIPEEATGRGCKWPWKGSYITAEGHVTPCCENGADPERISFGNVFEQPFARIWRSEAYRQFRAELRSPTDRPSICADCPSYYKPRALAS